MKKFILSCVLATGLIAAPAQVGKSTGGSIQGKWEGTQQTIDVPKPITAGVVGKEGTGWHYTGMIDVNGGCADVNTQLLTIIGELTDQDSVSNEIKFEADNHLSPSAINDRRLTIITKAINNLRTHRGGQ